MRTDLGNNGLAQRQMNGMMAKSAMKKTELRNTLPSTDGTTDRFITMRDGPVNPYRAKNRYYLVS